ncbi:MAG: hypothetical protein COV91_02740 [Candidatus Taylorbacteria bacterium CG11_big_fil_rev_8_21_14_0_20_46_11]|uniref:Uncharacterized protein n=1 Tax=Candidatus Taylorbacteria bacterium CG11_big_fil_rev_8_21_14_0_20_46_11 TaxID=1975025 RepID=A0A2H0KBV5_9BACT|nr:MAG: hypothetical protein COV91_02740 [Candidatus Taylorbacteria bacterium CG11_big_fil_rev_8_21_14_0_20_46_11]
MPKIMTIDDLAVMVKRGFDETAKQVDLNELKEDVSELRKQVNRIEARMGGYDNRLDLVVDDVRLVKTKVGIK